MSTADADHPRAAGVSIFAPAKINLFLHVTGRRPDGYHELDSLIAFADVGDRVCAVAADGLSLHLDGAFSASLGEAADNLVMRAARRLADAAGITQGAALTLEKNLPVAAGIGGGSADAAAALRALDSLWRIGAGEDDLARIGLALGADVPVCLFGKPARVGGIGEIIEPAALPRDVGVVLVNPRVAVQTAAVFAARRGPYSSPARFAGPVDDAAALAAGLRACRNDLDAAARTIAPVIGEVEDAIAAAPDCLLSRLSGSGATGFGLFRDEAAAERAAAGLSVAHAAWWVSGTRLLADDATRRPARRRRDG